jgi:UDP-N-acetylmuramate-alanine ligase
MEASLLTDRSASRRAQESISRLRRAHLVGVAGSGMRALANVLADWGWRLSGSDCRIDGIERLAACGVRLFQGHAAEQLSPETELVVYSDAVPASNPELCRAAELGIPALSYFQTLGLLSANCHTVAVAGTHGKSTTTAMAAQVLIDAGRDPTVFCGATPLGAASGGHAASGGRPASGGHAVSGGRAGQCSPLPLGEGQEVRAVAEKAEMAASRGQPALTLTLSQRERGPWLTRSQRERGLLLVEACEYRANFLNLRPWHAAILGIEPDHFDCYDSLEQIEDAFRRFAAAVPAEGMLLVRHDCESTRRATVGLPCRVESFGLSPEADWSARIIKPRPLVAPGPGATNGRGFMGCAGWHFEIRRFGRPLCEVRLQTPGRHNVLNALAAAALAWENGATADEIAAGLGRFAGLHRRLEMLGMWRGVTLVDDYAHHPTEVSATLETIRQLFPRRRVWCVFQPHQASRTARLLDELAASLQNADRVLVAEIFRAREGNPQPGEVTAADLARRTAALGVEVLPGHAAEEIVRTLETHLVPGDVLVTLGAGDVERLRPM